MNCELSLQKSLTKPLIQLTMFFINTRDSVLETTAAFEASLVDMFDGLLFVYFVKFVSVEKFNALFIFRRLDIFSF